MKIISSLLIIVLLALCLACPTESSVRRAAKTSYQLSGLTLETIKAVGEAYRSGAISLEQKDALANKLIIVAQGGKLFNNAVVELNKLYAQDLPLDKWQILSNLFSEQVFNPFLDFLEKSLSITLSEKVKATIRALRSAVLLIARTFDKNTVLPSVAQIYFAEEKCLI